MSEQVIITVQIGSIVAGSGGLTRDARRTVEFEGVELATYSEPGEGRDGGVTDTRGVKETLYRVADGRLIVHVEDWSRWQGEPTTSWLAEVTEADLGPAGRFAFLGEAAGLGRPLSLDEALDLDDAWDEGEVTPEEFAAFEGRDLVDDGLPRRSLHTA